MENIKKINLHRILEYVLLFIIIILSIKKMGYYKSDVIFCELAIVVIYVVDLVFKIMNLIVKKNKQEKDENISNYCNKKRINFSKIIFFFVSIAYFLPIVVDNYSNIESSLDYVFRYFCAYIVYSFVSESKNKSMYIYCLIFISCLQCIFGIDQLGLKKLEPFLKLVNASYIKDINLDRMSSTSQYANVFAINLLVSNILLYYEILGKFDIAKICSIKANYKTKFVKKGYKNILKFVLLSALFFCFSACIVLSMSKACIILYLVSIALIPIFLILKSRKNSNLNLENKTMCFDVVSVVVFIMLHLCLIFTCTSFINKLQKINSSKIYVVFACYIVVTFLIFTLMYFVYNFFKERNNEKLGKQATKKLKKIEKNNKKIRKLNDIHVRLACIIGIAIFVFFGILSLFLVKKSIVVNSKSEINKISRNIYKLNVNKENDINIELEKNEEDSRYEILVYAVDKNFDSEVVARYTYYSKTSDDFCIKYVPNDKFNYLVVDITCTKGIINVTKIEVNGDNYTDFLLLPSDSMYKILETFRSNLSLKDRYNFYKDAIKISTSSVKNFVFGLGGRGYENLAIKYRMGNYSSTEAHSGILQILVESGIIGSTLVVVNLFFTLKRQKNVSIYTYVLFVYLLHTLIDINLSYMFNLLVIAILMANIQSKDILLGIKSEKNVKNVDIYKYCFLFITASMVVNVLINQNIAYYCKMKMYEYDETCSLKEKSVIIKHNIEVTKSMSKKDPFCNDYIQKENELYEQYLKLTQIDEKTRKAIISDMSYNIKRINKNDKNSINSKLNLSDFYINYLNELVRYFDIEYNDGIEYNSYELEKYKYYLEKAYQILFEISSLKYNEYSSSVTKETARNYVNKLNEYIDKSLLKIENDNVSEIYDDMLKRYTKLFEILSQ